MKSFKQFIKEMRYGPNDRETSNFEDRRPSPEERAKEEAENKKQQDEIESMRKGPNVFADSDETPVKPTPTSTFQNKIKKLNDYEKNTSPKIKQQHELNYQRDMKDLSNYYQQRIKPK